ncbi:hypothetical protein ABW19_dt0208240 [Dactylella cylindrospora]|nr:hypothetical protein ABW19_dt0208240 [Dactylella cylindrospora]
MPPIRRKKKGEDDSSESSQPSRTASKSTITSKAMSSRTNPLGNKAGRPAKSRNIPDDQESSRPTTKPPIPRHNPVKPPVTKHQPNPSKVVAVVPQPRRSPTPVSPVSPIAHEYNQLSIREPTPPSADEMAIELRESEDEQREMVVRTPTSTMKRKKAMRKISQFEKDRIIENIKYEAERRAKALRQRYTLQADMLRQSIELRVGRIPYKMRNMTMGELYDQSIAIAGSTKEKENRLEAQRTVKELEDVRRLSNPNNVEPQLKVTKKRAVSPVPLKTVKSAIPTALKSPVTATAEILQPPKQEPPHALSPAKPPSFTQKTVATIKNKLAPKKPTTTAAASRTAAKTNAATAAAAAAAKTAKGTKVPKGKTTGTTATAGKTGGRALRSRK